MKKKSHFEFIIKHIIRSEGVFSDHKLDPGKATKYGISLRFYKRTINSKATAEDIKKLTYSEAKEIYYEYFWMDTGIYLIRSQKIAHLVLDQAINVGVNVALKRLEDTLKLFIKNKSFHIEKIDENVISILAEVSNRSRSRHFYDAYFLSSVFYYLHISNRNKNLRVFLRGWINRLRKVFDIYNEDRKI